MNEDSIRKLQLLCYYEGLKSQYPNRIASPPLAYNLNTVPNFTTQGLTPSILWDQLPGSLTLPNILQNQLLLRAHLAAAGRPGNFQNLTQTPVFSSNFSSLPQGVPQIIETAQSPLDIYLSQLRLARSSEKLEPIVEKPLVALSEGQTLKDTTNDSLTKDLLKLAQTEETNADKEEAGAEKEQNVADKVLASKKIKKREIICGHPERKHYAKGYCSECYHKKCRMQKPKLCPHESLYARELCQRCYAEKYKKKGKRDSRHHVTANRGLGN